MSDLILKELSPLLLAFAGAVIIVLYSIPVLVKVASIRHLTDRPGPRKIHQKDISTVGGIAIYGGFAIGFLLAINGNMQGVTYFSVSTLILFFVGMKDDLITLDPRKRLIIEIIAILIIIYFTDIRLTSFHGFMGISVLPTWLTYVTTIFIMVVIINSMNLIDGIDGLAASTGIITSVAYGIWFWLSDDIGYAIMAAALAGALTAFLRYNLSEGKNKVFMGDTGSLVIGFILAVMTIRFNEVNSGTNTVHNLESAPAISIAILIVPLFDTLRVFTIRILHGHHPFTADNRHIHHIMLRAGYSQRRTAFFICLAHILIIIMALLLDQIGILWLSLVLLLVCISLTGIVYVLIYKNHTQGNIILNKEESDTIHKMTFLHRVIRKKGSKSQTLL